MSQMTPQSTQRTPKENEQMKRSATSLAESDPILLLVIVRVCMEGLFKTMCNHLSESWGFPDGLIN